jgi:hypothetical protein
MAIVGNRRAKAPFALPIMVGAVLLSVVLGIAIVFGVIPLMAIGSLLAALILVAFPLAGLWVLAVGSLCVAGMVELYLPGLQQLRWAFVLMAMLLAVSSVIGHFARATLGASAGSAAPDITAIVPLAALFFSMSAVSALLSGQGVLGTLSGLKGYFQIWGLWIALYFLHLPLPQVARFVGCLLPLAVLQWPVVLHQYFFLVPLRHAMEGSIKGLVAIDVVAGTFGGSMTGGGRSPVLVLLSMAGMTLAVMRYRVARSKSLVWTWALVLLCIGPLAFSEVKLIFVLLPFTLLLLFGSLITKRPAAVVLGAGVTAAALVGMLFLYSAMLGVKGGSGSRVEDYVYASLGYNTGSAGYGNAGLNRTTVYKFWWQEHAKTGNVVQALFGHGPGVVNTASVTASKSLAAKRYAGFFPGLTGLSTLLWEVGVLGTLAFLAFLGTVYLAARRLERQDALASVRPELVTARVLVALLAVSLLHNNLLQIDLATQTLLALAVGLVLVAGRQAASTPLTSLLRPSGRKIVDNQVLKRHERASL